MSALLIRQGRMLDPATDVDRVVDILIDDGRIEQVGESVDAPRGCKELDASGCWVTPGLIELSCYSGEPGREDRETFATMLESAARGGFTDIALEPSTIPVHDEAAVTTRLFALADAQVQQHPNRARPIVAPLGALSKSLRGKEQTDVGELRAAGVEALSDGGNACAYSFLRRALEYAASHQLPVHLSTCRDARVNEGPSAARLGLKAQHRHEEAARIQEACALTEMSGAQVHLSAVSTEAAVATLVDSPHGLTASVAVCHLFDHDAQLAAYEPTSKLVPPLRSLQDCAALRRALGTHENLSLSARHRPRTYTEMRTTFDDASGGRSTLETAVARSLTLVREDGLDPLAWTRLWTTAPARALGRKPPSLATGEPAQITIIDPNQVWSVVPSSLASRGRNVPPTLGSLTGRVTYTIVAGRLAFDLTTEAG